MNLKTTFILFGVLLAILVTFALTQFFGAKPGPASEWVFADMHEKTAEIKAGDIDAVTIERHTGAKDETIELVRDDQGWKMQEPLKTRMDAYQINTMVTNLVNARREKSEMSSKPDEYGLENPAVVITLHKGDQEWKLDLGEESSKTATAVVYARVSAKPKDLMAIKKADTLEGVYKPISELRSHELLAATQINTQAISLQAPKHDPITLEKGPSSFWSFKEPKNYGEADFEGEQTGIPPGLGAKPITGMRDLLEALGQLRVGSDADFLADDVGDEELASKYGLAKGKPSYLRLEVTRNPISIARAEGIAPEGAKEALLIGKVVPADVKKETEKDKKDKDKEKEKDEPKAEYRYARLESESSVVRVPVKKIEPFLKVAEDPDPLRDHTLVRLKGDSVDALDIKNAAGLMKLRLVKRVGPSKQWKLFREGSPAQDADDGSLLVLINRLIFPRQIKTFDPKGSDKDLGFDQPTAIISVWEEGIAPEEKKEDDKKDADKKEEKKDDKKDADKKEEKKDDKKDEKKSEAVIVLPKLKSDEPTVTLTFGKRDRDKGILYVRRQKGKLTVTAAVPDTLLESMTAGPLTYLDKKLPQYDEAEPDRSVQEIILTRNGATLKLEATKQGMTDIWRFKEPKELEGRAASQNGVQGILFDLQRMAVQRLAAEKPSSNDLDKLYGLKSPQVEARIVFAAKDKKPVEYVYQFGMETPDKTGVFAKESHRDVVFVVSKSALDPLKAELRDPTIFKFENKNVSKVKITGWKDVIGSPFVLEMDRLPGGTWKAIQPADFKIDPDQAEAFLNLIHDLHAERFLTPQDLPKIDTAKLDVKENGLIAEITVAGEKEPLKLTLGVLAPPDNKSYYATAGHLQKDVFLVPKERFEKVKSKPKFFNEK